jgi:DNA helicase-2/ATP-dependent DNA helicase PcrA
MNAAPSRIEAAELARRLGLPPPTPEQEAVITSPLRPTVVVAGAGSGKTETMVSRVVWLVANGLVAPERVLGLTFTAKAAAELGTRLRARLAQLRAGVAVDEEPGDPTVLTYHAYAGRLVAEHGLRLAVEPQSRLLTEAVTWSIAHRVVMAYDGDLDDVSVGPAAVTEAVVELAGSLAEHLSSTAELRAWTERFEARLRAPAAAGRKGMYAAVAELLTRARARTELIPMIEAYQQAKRAAVAMDFGDQMSIAARIAERFEEVGRIERSRYGVVLLDEYQDTSHAQLVLMRSLFGHGHPVTAVGDPCQSIYGWRGASASGLGRFAANFRPRDAQPVQTLALTTSFRNSARVLDVANQISGVLREDDATVPVLSPGPACGEGAVSVALLPTVTDEAGWIADRVDEVWQADTAARVAGHGRSVAVLARRRSSFAAIDAALRARGIPVEIVGLGGLLAVPEVREIVSVLRVLHDPGAGDALMRLLTSARWRIGPRDLRALARRARWLARGGAPPDASGAGADPRPSAETGAGDSSLLTASSADDPVDQASIVEALADLGPAGPYSPTGYRRLVALQRELDGLRARASAPVTELVADVERVMAIGVEVVANGGVRAHIDRFIDVAAQYAQELRVTGDAESATPQTELGGFLAYLEAAEARERGLEPGAVEVAGDRVQILTVHAAKGLEWDVVVVSGLTRDVFPDRKAQSSKGWATDLAQLPYPVRKDVADLPSFPVESAADQKQLHELYSDYLAAIRARGAMEERRLAYVALTRARGLLLCSGHWWGDAIKPRGPSEFLAEIRQTPGVRVDCWAEPPAEGEDNPVLAADRSVLWPGDPLGERRAAIEEGAALVRARVADLRRPDDLDPDDLDPDDRDPDDLDPDDLDPDDRDPDERGVDDPQVAGWIRDADLLLAELNRPRQPWIDVPLPDELSVSALVTLRRDPAELARRVRRPMPTRPAPLARRGTAFHAWLETLFGGAPLLDVDELPGAADEGAADDADLAALQEAFLRSEWAQRRPIEIEVPFETRIGSAQVRGRMDAVFADPDGGYTVVDWKTGAEPSGEGLRAAAVQLAAYRVAWADLSGVPVERVRAAFHYVRTGHTVRPDPGDGLLDADGLAQLMRSVPAE